MFKIGDPVKVVMGGPWKGRSGTVSDVSESDVLVDLDGGRTVAFFRDELCHVDAAPVPGCGNGQADRNGAPLTFGATIKTPAGLGAVLTFGAGRVCVKLWHRQPQWFAADAVEVREAGPVSIDLRESVKPGQYGNVFVDASGFSDCVRLRIDEADYTIEGLQNMIAVLEDLAEFIGGKDGADV